MSDVSKVKSNGSTYNIKDDNAITQIVVGETIMPKSSSGVVTLEDYNMAEYDGCPKVTTSDGNYTYRKNIKYLNNEILSTNDSIVDYLKGSASTIATMNLTD